jgi:AcrR family transcriptional regulator
MSNERAASVRKLAARARRPDRRVARTERALGAALVELMAARRFDDISVQQVLDRARVGRATFYAHFRNKHDLLLSETERFCTLLDAHLDRVEGADGRRLAPVAELFAHVAEFHAFQASLASSGLRGPVYDLLGGHLARGIERRLARRPPADRVVLSHAATARVLAAALMELLRWWLERDARPTPREMDAHFHAIALGGVGGRA